MGTKVKKWQATAPIDVDVGARLSTLLGETTQSVRPPQRMIRFYNSIGRLPLRTGTFLLLLTSIDAVKVISLAGILGRTDAALQVIYEYRFRPWRLLWAVGDHLWQGSYNCRSVRARGRFVRRAVRFLLGRFTQELTPRDGRGHKLTVISLGSGSASQLFYGIMDNGFGTNDVRVILVDRNPRALKAGRENAHQLGLGAAIEFQEITIGRFLRQVVAPVSVDLFEMVGLADYFEDRQLRQYLHGIYTALVPGGLFLGSNISDQEEAVYAHGAARWPRMYYRSRMELVELLGEAGFEEIWTGACGLYTIWVAQKFT